MKLDNAEKQLIQTERACSDLRRGMAVVVTAENGEFLLAISPDNLSSLQDLTANSQIKNKKIIISKARAGYLMPDSIITGPVALKAEQLNIDDIESICSRSPVSLKLSPADFANSTQLEQSALQLAKIAELIPAIIIFEFSGDISDLIAVKASAIESYGQNANYSLIEASDSPLTLANAKNSRIIAYRPNVGGAEHYAIIIGNPGEQPLVRIHSSCYTGDLLASLDCDCRDQLQSAIELMGKGEGGIILYLMQEGRGIGLVNKLRAYDLKNKGMDTVEANHALGFDDDERLFLPAAEILKKMNINSLRLLTNNPRKAAGLEEYGIKVTACVPHIMESNEHNKSYLQAKVDRLGHLF